MALFKIVAWAIIFLTNHPEYQSLQFLNSYTTPDPSQAVRFRSSNQVFIQPRSQGFSLFVIGKAGKGPGTGRSHDFQHPDIVGVINYTRSYYRKESAASPSRDQRQHAEFAE